MSLGEIKEIQFPKLQITTLKSLELNLRNTKFGNKEASKLGEDL